MRSGELETEKQKVGVCRVALGSGQQSVFHAGGIGESIAAKALVRKIIVSILRISR
jgi:3-deoxy-D-manno-octulosonic-acid transferase